MTFTKTWATKWRIHKTNTRLEEFPGRPILARQFRRNTNPQDHDRTLYQEDNSAQIERSAFSCGCRTLSSFRVEPQKQRNLVDESCITKRKSEKQWTQQDGSNNILMNWHGWTLKHINTHSSWRYDRLLILARKKYCSEELSWFDPWQRANNASTWS